MELSTRDYVYKCSISFNVAYGRKYCKVNVLDSSF